MAKETNVKHLDGDENSVSGVQKISLGSKSIVTPIKALDVSRITPEITVNPGMRGLNEIYKRLTPEGTHKLITDPEHQRRFNSQLNWLKNKTNPDEAALCFMEYTGPSYPTNKELEFIADTSYEYSDVTPLPILAHLESQKLTEQQFNQYTKFAKNAIETIEQLNHKPIMGIIPNIGFVYVPDLVEFYLEEGINSFCVNLDGRNPITLHQTIRAIMRTLKGRSMLHKSFLHAINSNPGRAGKDASIIEAKDILGFSLGFNSIGEKHKPLKAPKEFFQKLQKDTAQNKVRLFNKEDYGYYKAVDIRDLDNFLPHDTALTSAIFKKRTVEKRVIQKIFNMEQQGLEALRLREVIKQESTPLGYLAKKSHVNKDDLKKITKINTDIFKRK